MGPNDTLHLWDIDVGHSRTVSHHLVKHWGVLARRGLDAVSHILQYRNGAGTALRWPSS